MLATLRHLQSKCPCFKCNYIHARGFSSQPKPTKFFNFITKPKNPSNKTENQEKDLFSTKPFTPAQRTPFRARPISRTQSPSLNEQNPPSKPIEPKTIDGTIIENKFVKKIEAWPYREATEVTVNSFSELGLHEDICTTLAAKQIVTPTPVQSSILHNMLLGEHMLVRSQTGTGKTIAMVAGILQQVRSFCTEEERKGVRNKEDRSEEKDTESSTKDEKRSDKGKREIVETKKRGMKALVIVPTRELAWQITKWIIELENVQGSHKHFVQLCAAGVEISNIISSLRKHNPHIVVGTPKQLIQILHEAPDALDFSALRTLVIDEVDHIVQAIGIYASLRQKENKKNHPRPGVALVKEIKSLFSTHAHQMIVMSATLNSPTKREIWKNQWMEHPVLVNYGTVSLPASISHHLVFAEGIGQTEEQLIELVNAEVKKNPSFRALVFIDPMASVRDQVKRLSILGVNSVDLSTALSFENPAETKKTFENFLKGQDVRLFITTEFTARGFDLPNMDTVFILGVFFTPQSYIHMAGRTGRMGNKGQVITIMPPDRLFKIRSIFRFLDIEFPANLKEEIERVQAEVAEEEELDRELEEEQANEERDEERDEDEGEEGANEGKNAGEEGEGAKEGENRANTKTEGRERREGNDGGGKGGKGDRQKRNNGKREQNDRGNHSPFRRSQKFVPHKQTG